ncbi:hypothetical protein QBL02_02600 [Leucobacter sp. UT-8R-CII-1-4]|uniref:hypothetical protein n=1 Tax=Leucobacter sp. UT-8R-CII-1-4 TaxID=3040075 RepID=UPI0024A9FC47|nr:hypothetical protein [Leucobacter sp. UT-8R-CII-1-4]MDI6022429.1 hypothetical protein [Leucobacter sp. UT-8R-CII-1-4]
MKRKASLALMTGIMVTATLALSGCGVSISHSDWERRISQSDAVISADWEYLNNWPTGGSVYTGRVILDMGMTEQQAREMAQLSCREDAIFDEIHYEADSQGFKIVAEKRGLQGKCSDEEELANFSRILEVLNRQPASFEADLLVWSYETRTDYATGEEETKPPSIRFKTTTVEDLFAFAEQAHAAVGVNDPFSFTGAVDEKVSLLSDTGMELDIDVPAGLDLSKVFPILAEAYLLDHRGIKFREDDGIVVAMNDLEYLASEDTNRVRELADAAGVPFNLVFGDNPYGSSTVSAVRQQFLADLAVLPSVESAQLDQHSTIEVTTTSVAGIDEVLDYFEQNGGEHVQTLNDSFVNGADKVSVLLTSTENKNFKIRLDGGVSSLSDLRTMYGAATEILAENPEIYRFHIQSWPDKFRILVEFEDHASASGVEATEQKLKELLPVATLEEINTGRFNGRTEKLT